MHHCDFVLMQVAASERHSSKLPLVKCLSRGSWHAQCFVGISVSKTWGHIVCQGVLFALGERSCDAEQKQLGPA